MLVSQYKKRRCFAMRVSKRKGFTLVELLIVIVVIGILASAMMLSSGSASESAKASSAIAELRNVKAATLLWFTDRAGATESDLRAMWALDWWTAGSEVTRGIAAYMDNPEKGNLFVNGQYVGIYLLIYNGNEYWISLAYHGSAGQNVLSKIATMGAGTIFVGSSNNPYHPTNKALAWIRVR